MYASNKDLIIIDGDCPFCNHTMIRIARLDKRKDFLIAASSSATVQEIISADQQEELKRVFVDTIVVRTVAGEYLQRAAAIFYLVYRLAFGVSAPRMLLRLFSLSLFSWLYDQVAARRLSIVKGACPIPPPDVRKRFVLS